MSIQGQIERKTAEAEAEDSPIPPPWPARRAAVARRAGAPAGRPISAQVHERAAPIGDPRDNSAKQKTDNRGL